MTIIDADKDKSPVLASTTTGISFHTQPNFAQNNKKKNNNKKKQRKLLLEIEETKNELIIFFNNCKKLIN